MAADCIYTARHSKKLTYFTGTLDQNNENLYMNRFLSRQSALLYLKKNKLTLGVDNILSSTLAYTFIMQIVKCTKNNNFIFQYGGH